MLRTRIAFAAVAAAGLAVVPAAAASATTVPSTIGALTDEQYHGVYSDDIDRRTQSGQVSDHARGPLRTALRFVDVSITDVGYRQHSCRL